MKDKDAKILEEKYDKINEDKFSDFDVGPQSDEFIPPEFQEDIRDQISSAEEQEQAVKDRLEYALTHAQLLIKEGDPLKALRYIIDEVDSIDSRWGSGYED